MEFPRDRPLLRIGELSRRLAVSDHVLRAWENRYGLLQPVRSPGGFRLYSEADGRRIRRMQAYLADGLSAAEAARAALSGDASTRPGRPAGPPLASAGDGLSAALRQALVSFDEPAAHAVLDRLLADLSVPAVLRDVVLPYLAELGERWQRGTASVAMEHFASNVIRGRLAGLARGWGSGHGPQALLACPPALREEENRPAPPSQQVIASPVTGPTPYSRSASTLAPDRLRAAASSRRRSTPRRASSPASMSKAVATCSCPAGDRCAAAAAPSACRSRSVRSAPSPSAGAPWWKNTAQLRLAGVLGPQIVIGLQQRPAFQDVRRRDPALRQPAPGQQLPQVPRVGLAGLGVPLAAAGERGISRLGDVRRDAGPGQLLRDVPPAGAPLQRERDVVPAGEPRQPGTQVRAVSRGDLAALHLPGPGVQVVERELLPVDIQPAYDGHRDLLKLQRGISTPRECITGLRPNPTRH